MGDGDVVALEVVVDVDLPVAIDDVVAAFGELQAGKSKAAGLLRNFAEESGEWFGVRIKINEDELLPGFAAQRNHAHGRTIEELDAVNIRCADEAAVESVGPAVIGAAENISRAAALRDGAGAMT